MEEAILTPDQVAQILQVHPFTVLKFIKQGKLKASKLGRVYRIRRTDVDAFLDEQAAKSTPVKEMNESNGSKSKKTGKIKKATPSKDASGDSALTPESKEEPLQEPLEPQVKEPTIVTDRDEEVSPHRRQEDHYVIELKL